MTADERSARPYLAFALLCEKVLRERDDTLTFVRVVDRVNLTVQSWGPSGPELPTLAPVQIVALTLVIGLKSGPARGTGQLKVEIDSPSGFKYPALEVGVNFEGDDDRGLNVIVPFQFPAQDQGIYWFLVTLDGELLTKVPLRVTRSTVTQTTPPQLPF